jgi:hypothetical protein
METYTIVFVSKPPRYRPQPGDRFRLLDPIVAQKPAKNPFIMVEDGFWKGVDWKPWKAPK